MTLDELHESLPDELRVEWAGVPEDIRTGIEYLVARDALIDNDGVAVADLPSYQEWKGAQDG